MDWKAAINPREYFTGTFRQVERRLKREGKGGEKISSRHHTRERDDKAWEGKRKDSRMEKEGKGMEEAGSSQPAEVLADDVTVDARKLNSSERETRFD